MTSSTQPQSQSPAQSLLQIPLVQLATGSNGKVIKIGGDKKMTRQMMGLGISVGSEVEILQRRGKGVVVRSKGTRIAIGESIAALLLVTPSLIKS